MALIAEVCSEFAKVDYEGRGVDDDLGQEIDAVDEEQLEVGGKEIFVSVAQGDACSLLG